MALSSSKKLSALLKGIASTHHDDFCLNCLHSFSTEKKNKSHKKVYKNKDFCNVIILSEYTRILELNLINHHLLFMQILNVQ